MAGPTPIVAATTATSETRTTLRSIVPASPRRVSPPPPGHEADAKNDKAPPADAVPRDEQRVHRTCRIPDHEVASRRCRVNADHAKDADDHPRLRSHDRLQWVVGAQAHRPRREQLVESGHELQHHEQRAGDRDQRQVDVVAAGRAHAPLRLGRMTSSGITAPNPASPSIDSGREILGGATWVPPTPAPPS